MRIIKYIILLVMTIFFFFWTKWVVFASLKLIPSTTLSTPPSNDTSDTSDTSDSTDSVKNFTFDLNPMFNDNKIITEPPTLEKIVGRFINFLVAIVSALAVLGIIVWGFMVMFAWTGDLQKQWLRTILYSIYWIGITMGSYALVKLVQILVFSIK